MEDMFTDIDGFLVDEGMSFGVDFVVSPIFNQYFFHVEFNNYITKYIIKIVIAYHKYNTSDKVC